MDNLELEQYITCPITGLIFSDPVKADDGHTYERSAIKEWLQKNDTSPLTTIKIGKYIIPDFSINSLVQQFIQKNPKRKKINFNLK